MANLMFGRWPYGRYIYAGKASSFIAVDYTYPLQASGFAIRFYDDEGIRVKEYSSDMQNNPVLELEFEHEQTGCGYFSFTLAKIPSDFEIAYGMRVDIHLFGDNNPWYSGYITVKPSKGTTKDTVTYEGYGFYGQLSDIIVNHTYDNTEISNIVRELMISDIEPKTDVVYSSTQITSTGYTATKLKFAYVTAKDAIEDLADYAGNFIVGVDEYRKLFFKPENSAINEDSRFWVGWHIHTFEPEVSIDDVRNHLFIKASGKYVTKLTADITASQTSIAVASAANISKDDTIKIDDESMTVTNVAGATLTVSRGQNSTDAAAHVIGSLVSNESLSSSGTRILYECHDDDSISAYGLKQDVLSIPSAMTFDDAQRWGDYKLQALKDPVTSGEAENIILKQKLIKADGKARVTTEDGDATYEMPINKASYYVSASDGIRCTLEFGEPSTSSLDVAIAKMVRDAKNNNLIKQYEGDDE